MNLKTVGYGGTRPLGAPEKNRRVEIYMMTFDVSGSSYGPKSYPNMLNTQVGELFSGSDDSQRPWKIGRGTLRFAKEAKKYVIEQLGQQKLLKPL